jgi:hypothetical protein
MLILLFKADSAEGPDKEPIEDKMRRILESHVEDAETAEDRERAEMELRKFGTTSGRV